MKIKELIEILKNIKNQDRIVILSKDAEGNDFSPLSDFSINCYRKYNSYSGEIGIEKLTKELKEKGFTEEDVIEGAEPSITLWPSN